MHTLKKHETKRQYLSRLRSKARELRARVYATPEGKLLLVRGKSDPPQMVRYLTHLDALSSHIVTPSDVGFPRDSAEEVTVSMLTESGRALTKWSRALTTRHRRRQTSGDDLTEQREIQDLGARLKQLHGWRRQAACDGTVDRSPWMLDGDQEATLESVLKRSRRDSGSFPKLARLVMWIAGQQATSRFCDAAQLLVDSSPETDARKLLRASLAKLDVWQQRSAFENWGNLRREMGRWIGQLPPHIVARAGLSSKLRGREFPDRIAEQRASCKQALRECSDGRRHRIAAAIASIVSSDNSAAPLPQHLVRSWIESNDDSAIQRSTLALLAEAKQPAYDKLLYALDELPVLPIENLRFIRQQLCSSQTTQDIKWALTNDLQYYFDDPAVRPSWARQQVEALALASIKLSGSRLRRFLDSIHSAEDRDVVADFVRWTATLPRAVRTPRVCQLIEATLFEVLLPGISQLKSHGKLRDWIRSNKVKAAHRSPETFHWTEKIHQCQNAMGMERSLPTAVRSLLDFRQTRRAEHEHLRRLDSRGLATDSQIARMRYLSDSSNSASEANARKLLRVTQASYVHIAMKALRYAVRSEAVAVVGERLTELLPSTSLHRLLQSAAWVRAMSATERQLLDEVLEAHQVFGADYKCNLPINDQWIAAARARGIDVDAWLTPTPSEVRIGDSKIRISTAHDLVDIFLMGTYFDTCLSLGQENQLAVLANAADANKQVIFLHDQHGRVLGRQLLTINKDDGLLGYYCYLNEEGTNEDRRKKLAAALATYCGQLAQRCGVPLAEVGAPASLGDHFWYDDDPVEWHASARKAFRESNLSRNVLVSITDCP
ncbi:MAG: hypothetical protein ACR2NM_14785, partial [Bythopirellula sp.]